MTNTTIRWAALCEFRKLKEGCEPVTLRHIAEIIGCDRLAVQDIATSMSKAGMLCVQKARNAQGGGQLCLYTPGPNLHVDGLFPIRKPLSLDEVLARIPDTGATRKDVMDIMDRSIEDRVGLLTLAGWVRAGSLVQCSHSGKRGSRQFRYFKTESDMRAWLSARQAEAEAKRLAEKPKPAPRPSRIKQAQERKARRAAKGLKPLTPRIPGTNKPAQPKQKKQSAVNLITKAMPKAKPQKPKVLPPALMPGEPNITEETKVERRRRPAGKYEVTKKLSGLSRLPFGVYLEPESGWVTAAKNARYLEAA